MRVITGSARGRRLNELKGYDTRPTTDKVKEGIFSAIQFEVEGARVLDLFAGTGQLGIEALSRGAQRAVFVDRRTDAVKLIRENLALTRLEDGAREEGCRGGEGFGPEVGIGACEELFVERPPHDGDDVALFGSGNVGFGNDLRRQGFPFAEGEFQHLEGCD